MKNLMPFLIVILTFSCDSSNQIFEPEIEGRLNEEIELKFGQIVNLENGTFSIKFKSLVEDSRCPEDVVCPFSGTVRILLEILQNEVTVNRTLQPTEIIVGGYNIKLLEVNPYPNTSKKYRPKDYSVKITVSK